MARLMRTAFIVLAVLGFSPDVQAVPSFTWEGPWNVTLLENCAGFRSGPFCSPAGERAFGASATHDGQILGTTADTAVARSEAQGALSGSSGSTGLNFSRQFLLSGSPAGWTVFLSSHLAGSMFAVSAQASTAPSIDLTFDMPIRDPNPGSGSLFRQEVNQSQLQTANLLDGLHTVAGRLFTGGSPGSGLSESDFFGSVTRNPGAGFQVSVTATPLPEPSSLLLLATGLAGAAWAYRKRAV